MNNLFETKTYTEVIDRLQSLTPEHKALWGKMTVAQMLAHSVKAFRVPLSEKKLPRLFIGYILGPLLKTKLYNETPWRKNLPTSPDFVIKDERNFQAEKQNLIDHITRFYSLGPMSIPHTTHPLFGELTPEQWGKSMYKHLDHHLQQFGV